MSRPTPRRPASSRGTAPRPRRLAGQSPVRPEALDSTEEPTEQPIAEPTAAISLAKKVTTPRSTTPTTPTTPEPPTTPDPSVRRVDPAGAPEAGPGVLARAKTTRVLIATLVVVAVALALQFAVLMVDRFRDDSTSEDGLAQSPISTSAERPVLASAQAVLEGVDAAAKAALEIVSVDYQKYDDEVSTAADLMTDRFATQYRETAADIETELVANQTVVQANVVAQGVVRADLTRLEALVFLNQVVSRVREGEPETVVTPFKVLVTMVHTDQGWLVDDLETDAPRDKTN